MPSEIEYTTKSKKVVLGTGNLFSMTDNQNRSTKNHFWSAGNLSKLIGHLEMQLS